MLGNPFLGLARRGKNGPQWYIITLVLAFGLDIIVSLGMMLAFGVTTSKALNQLDYTRYALLAFLPFLFITLALWLGLNFLHRRPFRTIVTAAPRFRWTNLLVSGGAWLLLSGLGDFILSRIHPGTYIWTFDSRAFFSYALLVLVLVPIQASAEEFLFRGYLSQGVSLLGRAPRAAWLLAWIVPSLLFGLLHGANPETAYGAGWYLLNQVVVGLLLGWITLRSYGLELSIGLHIANNLYSALIVTFAGSAIRSPALFTLSDFDPKTGVLVLIITIPLYLLLASAWKRGAVWRMVLVAALLLAGCAPTAPSARQATPAIPLTDCRLSAPGSPTRYAARCGQLEVPENRADPSGRKITIHFAVLPASSQNKAPDPLFLLAGGPGQAATEAFVPILESLDRVRFKRDLVLVDQRGTGGSNPLRCPKPADPELDQDGGEAQVLKDLETCVKGLNADPKMYTTEDGMADLDAVRQALGYDSINLLGVSYGTRAALTYLRDYSDRVRTVTLDSVTPMDWALGDTVAQDAQRSFDRMVARCQADPDCGKAFPNLKQEFTGLLATLEQQPASVNLPDPTTGEATTVKLTRTNAALTVRLMLYNSEYTALLPLLIHKAASGDLQPLAAQYLIVFNSFSQAMSDGMYMSVVCAEDVPFYQESAGGQGTDFVFNASMIRKECAIWPHAQPAPETRAPVQSNAPVLLLSGSDDPVTPPANAEVVAKTLSNSKQVVVSGLGHNVMYRGCLPKVINDFLESGTTANLDTTCAAQIQPDPFFLTYTGPKP